jgi:hypothetical protein
MEQPVSGHHRSARRRVFAGVLAVAVVLAFMLRGG